MLHSSSGLPPNIFTLTKLSIISLYMYTHGFIAVLYTHRLYGSDVTDLGLGKLADALAVNTSLRTLE